MGQHGTRGSCHRCGPVLAAWTSRTQDRVAQSRQDVVAGPQPVPAQTGAQGRGQHRAVFGDTRFLLRGLAHRQDGRAGAVLPIRSSPGPSAGAHLACALQSFLLGEPGPRSSQTGLCTRGWWPWAKPRADLDVALGHMTERAEPTAPRHQTAFWHVPKLFGFALCSYLTLEALVLEKGTSSSSKRPAAACATLASEQTQQRRPAGRPLPRTARRIGTHAWTLSWDQVGPWRDRAVGDGKPLCRPRCRKPWCLSCARLMLREAPSSGSCVTVLAWQPLRPRAGVLLPLLPPCAQRCYSRFGQRPTP